MDIWNVEDDVRKERVRLAQLCADKLKDKGQYLAGCIEDGNGKSVTKAVKVVRESGVLTGQRVYFPGKSYEGTLDGMKVICHCGVCSKVQNNKGEPPSGKSFSLSGWEEHADLSYHRPSQYIYLTKLKMSIQDFAELVFCDPIDETPWRCVECNDKAGEIMVCCTSYAAHPGCFNGWRCEGTNDTLCKKCWEAKPRTVEAPTDKPSPAWTKYWHEVFDASEPSTSGSGSEQGDLDQGDRDQDPDQPGPSSRTVQRPKGPGAKRVGAKGSKHTAGGSNPVAGHSKCWPPAGSRGLQQAAGNAWWAHLSSSGSDSEDSSDRDYRPAGYRLGCGRPKGKGSQGKVAECGEAGQATVAGVETCSSQEQGGPPSTEPVLESTVVKISPTAPHASTPTAPHASAPTAPTAMPSHQGQDERSCRDHKPRSELKESKDNDKGKVKAKVKAVKQGGGKDRTKDDPVQVHSAKMAEVQAKEDAKLVSKSEAKPQKPERKRPGEHTAPELEHSTAADAARRAEGEKAEGGPVSKRAKLTRDQGSEPCLDHRSPTPGSSRDHWLVESMRADQAVLQSSEGAQIALSQTLVLLASFCKAKLVKQQQRQQQQHIASPPQASGESQQSCKLSKKDQSGATPAPAPASTTAAAASGTCHVDIADVEQALAVVSQDPEGQVLAAGLMRTWSTFARRHIESAASTERRYKKLKRKYVELVGTKAKEGRVAKQKE